MKKWWLRIWLFLLTTLGGAALLGMITDEWPGLPVRNNIMDLLPALHNDPVLLQALQRNNQTLNRKLMILVGGPDKEKNSGATALVINSLQQQSFFSTPITGFSITQAKQIGQFYYQWRKGLLSEQQHQILKKNNISTFEQQLTTTLYSPISGINATLLSNDPTLTFYHFMRALPPTQGKIQSIDGTLQVADKNNSYQVIIVDIKQDVFDMNLHPAYTAWRNTLQNTLKEKYPSTTLLLMGTVQHAVWGADSAKHEVTIIGNGSLLGVILLVWYVFRGARALFVSLLPLGAGMLAGLIATLLCYGEIHLITLVFGSSVIGVAMDYSLHYLTEHYKDSDQFTSVQCMQRVFPGITMAMITSAIAYAAIGFAPFPVLRQIALFSCAGLFMAWLSVVSLYPSLMPTILFNHSRYLHWSNLTDIYLRQLFDGRQRQFLLVLITLAMIPGVLRIQANDDLRLLQTPEPSITAMEKKVQTVTGLQPDGRFLLIEGASLEQLLQRSEQFGEWLAETQPDALADLLTRYLPSEKRQRDNTELQRALYNSAFITKWQNTLGLPDEVIARQQQLFQNNTSAPDKPQQWLTWDTLKNSPLASMLERFQLSQTSRGWIVTGFVRNSNDYAAIAHYSATHDGVHWMDPVSDISNLFRYYREKTAWMMFFAYALIAALLAWRYPLSKAWRVMLAPVLAAWFTLGFLGYASIPLNLFHVLAMLLVLGVGIDYSIFFAEINTHRDAVMLAVILSTITTLLSFGLLALSKTAAISSFGIVISIGLMCALIFSPLAQNKSPSSQRNSQHNTNPKA